MSFTETKLHFPEGWIERGGKVRACCHCGYATTPRVDRRRARAALDTEHGWTQWMRDVDGRRIPVACGICGHKGDWSIDYPWDLMRPLVDGEPRGLRLPRRQGLPRTVRGQPPRRPPRLRLLPVLRDGHRPLPPHRRPQASPHPAVKRYRPVTFRDRGSPCAAPSCSLPCWPWPGAAAGR